MRVRYGETKELVYDHPGSDRMKIQRMEIQRLCYIDAISVPTTSFIKKLTEGDLRENDHDLHSGNQAI